MAALWIFYTLCISLPFAASTSSNENTAEHQDVPLRGVNHRFLDEKTKRFAVNGSSLPEVDFDVGESYAGKLPISNAYNESRQLFFWFWPTIAPEPKKEILIWLQGGPGCSSMLGFINENGPFTWIEGTHEPVRNAYDWRNLTNVLWVDQPVGTGFSSGNVSIVDEVGLSKQFLGFYEQFIKTFCVQGWDVYIVGESYAGTFIPWISAEFVARNDSDMPLKGISFSNPFFADSLTIIGVTIKDYYFFYQPWLGLNATTLITLTKKHIECGYDAYLKKYFTFPPPQEKFPVLDAAYEKYQRMSDYFPAPETVYFNRTDVQEAINIPVGYPWHEFSLGPVFVVSQSDWESGFNGDLSTSVAQTDILKTVIEATNNVMIGSGNLDAQLNANGTLLALQNFTWNGFQGFKQYPNKPFYVPYHHEWNQGSQSGAGIVGSWNEERGLTFYQVTNAGHLLPGDAPGAGYKMIEKLLGRIKDLSQTGTFTTQPPGNWTGGPLFKEDEGVPPHDLYMLEQKVREEMSVENKSQTMMVI